MVFFFRSRTLVTVPVRLGGAAVNFDVCTNPAVVAVKEDFVDGSMPTYQASSGRLGIPAKSVKHN